MIFDRSNPPAFAKQPYIVVIPARIGSSRLPRKPLADIDGKTMIERTYDAVLEVVDRELVFIATDSEEIAQEGDGFGANIVMTSSECLTGTDRLSEVAEFVPAQSYINVQGDEPLMSAQNIKDIIAETLAQPDAIINGWAWIDEEEEYRSRSVPKVVIREDGRLLYMSRSPIPGTKSDEFKHSRKQVCVYAFPGKALAAFVSRQKKTEHEALEDIEILRFLEMGWDVKMIELSGGSIAVDTPADLERARQIFIEKRTA